MRHETAGWRNSPLISEQKTRRSPRRLQARGFVSSVEAETAPSRGGRRRKYYHLEPEGAQALEATYTNVRSMADGTLDALHRVASEAESGARR